MIYSDASDSSEGKLKHIKLNWTFILKNNANSIFHIQTAADEHSTPINTSTNQSVDDDYNEHLEQTATSDIVEVVSNMTDLKVDNKENRNTNIEENQSNQSKKWYEGAVIRPVAFRGTPKRFNQNWKWINQKNFIMFI